MGSSPAQGQLIVNIGKNQITLPFLMLTPNLIIRPLLDQDYSVILNSVHESLKEMKMWLPWVDVVPNESEYLPLTHSLFEEAKTGTHCHFCVYHNETFLGMCSYMDIKNFNYVAKIGFWCRATEDTEMFFIDAINAVIRYGFEHCQIGKFHIPCVVGNYLGELAAKKLNFKLASLDFVEDKQIKNFFIDSIIGLPTLEVQLINNR